MPPAHSHDVQLLPFAVDVTSEMVAFAAAACAAALVWRLSTVLCMSGSTGRRRRGSAAGTADRTVTDTVATTMALVVRTDLKMGTGKAAAQCAHASVAAVEACMDSGRQDWAGWLRDWRHGGAASSTFAVDSEDDLRGVASRAQAAGLPSYLVRDAGRTQIAAGSRTVVAVGPGPASAVAAVIGSLQPLPA